jgi:thiol-disulfide isomerase/thioredoxin
VDADYTVIYIWDPDCGHCKKENPKVVEFNERFLDKGVKVFAVGNPYENEEWIEYLREHPEMGNLINVSDSPKHPDYFRTYYDVHSTPVTLLLDKDKKIIAKKVGIEQLEQILEREMEKNKKKKGS